MTPDAAAGRTAPRAVQHLQSESSVLDVVTVAAILALAGLIALVIRGVERL